MTRPASHQGAPPGRGYGPAAASCAALILACILSSPAGAQTIDYGSLEQLFGEPVTTSATGAPQRASEVPATMEIITADDIRRSGARDIPGVLKHVSGVDVLQWGTDSYDVGVRGYNQPYSPRILVLIDGRQVYADYFGFTPWSTLPVELGAIRQIEIVKGANSALFGFNAVSGVINIITYNPLYDDVKTASATAGTRGLAQGSFVGTGKLGANGGVRISVGGHSDQDFGTPLNADSLGSRRGNYRGAVDALGTFRLSDTVQVTLEASHTEVAQTEFLFGVYANVYDRYHTDSVKGQVNADTAIGALQASVYSNWIASDLYLGGGTTPTFPVNNQVTVAQLQDIFKLGTSNTIRLSAEYRHNTMPTMPDTGTHTYYDVESAGAIWSWKILPTLSLTNAIRLDYLTLGRRGTNPPGFPFDNSYWNRSFVQPSFNSGLVWQANELDTFRLTAARGIEVPELVGLGGILVQAGGAFLTGIPTIGPTVVMNYEASWDRAVPSLGGVVRMNLFHQTNSAIVTPLSNSVTIVNGVPLTTSMTIGNSDATGLELSVKGRFLENWRWGASYTPEIVTDHFNLPLSATGIDFQHTTPTHIVKANLGWARGPWEIDGYMQYKSSFYGIVSASPGSIDNGTLAKISDYVALDLRVAYKPADWVTLSVSAQNFSKASQRQTAGANVGQLVYGTLTVDF